MSTRKEKHCDTGNPFDDHCGDNWDYTAFDAEHRLVLEVVPGKRSRKRVREVVQGTKRRTGGRVMRLLTSDEFAPYREEIAPDTYRERTPAMAAGLADHVWTLTEWLTFPAKLQ